MLAFLDALCAALLTRNLLAIRELMSHPLAATLPAAVVDEAYRVLDGESRPYAAPLQTMRLYHQTAHLLGVRRDPASIKPHVPAANSRPEKLRQMELPLHMRVA